MTSQDELVLKLQRANAEIESLRRRHKDLLELHSHCQMQHDIMTNGLKKERDEYKRRLELVWEWMGKHNVAWDNFTHKDAQEAFIDNNPEAVKWFEKAGRNGN